MFTEPILIAKSSILLDVKPWDDETDMAKLEEHVRSIELDGLLWGQCKEPLHATVELVKLQYLDFKDAVREERNLLFCG